MPGPGRVALKSDAAERQGRWRAGRRQSIFIEMKYFLNGQAEETGGSDSQRQRGIKPSILDGIYRVSRYAQTLGQIRLAPALLGAENTNTIFQNPAALRLI